jgi:hypothetical protein
VRGLDDPNLQAGPFLRGSRHYAFAPVPDGGTQKKPSQVLLYGAQTNAQRAGDFLVAAALYQQIKHLLVSGRHLNSNEIHPGNSSWNLNLLHKFRCTAFAQPSLAIAHV